MRTYKCRFCGFRVSENRFKSGIKSAKYKMGEHYENAHKTDLPPDMNGYRFFYYLLTKKDRGSCIICKQPTKFNQIGMKYSRFCENPRCKQQYREQFKQQMIGKYGKIHLLNDPEKQKEMLANRKISGTYTWRDNSVTIPYTGSYELHFLEFLDKTLKWPSSDIIGPAPHIFYYEYKGRQHFYIPDFYIPSLHCLIEIKDNGSARQINPESREKDIIKDDLMRSNTQFFNYIKIVEKDYTEFLSLIKEEDT